MPNAAQPRGSDFIVRLSQARATPNLAQSTRLTQGNLMISPLAEEISGKYGWAVLRFEDWGSQPMRRLFLFSCIAVRALPALAAAQSPLSKAAPPRSSQPRFRSSPRLLSQQSPLSPPKRRWHRPMRRRANTWIRRLRPPWATSSQEATPTASMWAEAYRQFADDGHLPGPNAHVGPGTLH
jgi:hypothetical protein